jgi:hypothetical protein
MTMEGNFMERWLKRKVPDDANNVGNSQQRNCNVTFPTPQAPEYINWEEEIQFDPGKRKEICAYHPNLRESVRRRYLVNGPCQPRTLNFPSTQIGGKNRRFNPELFDEFGNWLEYSESTDRAYFLLVSCVETPLRKRLGTSHLLLMVGILGTIKKD